MYQGEKRVTPRDLRNQIIAGSLKPLSTKMLPVPPEEWLENRRFRMRIAARAAFLFVYRRKRWHEIAEKLSEEFPGEVIPDARRQRIMQYVEKGCEFLMDRGFFRLVV